MEAHSISQHGYFNEIIIGPKTPYAFKRAAKLGRKHLTSLSQGSRVETVVIGDSIERDIRTANEAGYTTVYIPGGFKGREVSRTEIDRPDFQIESILNLPEVLELLDSPPRC